MGQLLKHERTLNQALWLLTPIQPCTIILQLAYYTICNLSRLTVGHRIQRPGWPEATRPRQPPRPFTTRILIFGGSSADLK